MKNDKFDRLLSNIRNESLDDKIVSGASERVWKSVTGASAALEFAPQTLRSCEDFQSLMPAYAKKQLLPARALLFEDHVHSCVACRHALERARDGEPQRVFRLETKRYRSQGWRWALGVAAAAAVVVGVFAFSNGVLPGQHPVRASVESVDGSLYAGSGVESRLIRAGYQLGNADEVRTAKGSTAVLRLLDGSRVEMRERSDVSVSRAWRGTTIRLDGGQIIVQAAKQRSGRLYVATDDGLVSVKGTIFSVNRGTKGSRVAVIEGVVRVDYGEDTTELHAGEETTSSSSVSKVPITTEIAWSRDAAKYLALLGDFAVLQKQFASIPGPGLRYSSDLLPYVPDNTVVYAAIPNLADTLGEATRLFQDRLQQSPELRNWWKQQQKGNGPKLDEVIDRVKTFSGYLGSEVVVAVGKEGATYSAPIVLARVQKSGLESFLQTENRRLSSGQSNVVLQTVRDPWSVAPAPNKPLLVYVSNDLMIASPDLREIQRAATRVKQGASSQFAATPFYQQIAHSYEQGAEWLFCADMEQIVRQNVQRGSNSHDLPPGIGEVRFLTMEHREVGSKPETRADLMFGSERHGVASWLGAPASMGSLDFVSPNASMVTSAVVKNPRSIMEEIFQMIESGDANFSQHLSEFELKTGVNVLNDITAPLGGEVTMAFDGAMVPTPRWKVIFEVYDPATLQATIGKLVDSFNREAGARGHSLQLNQRQVGSRTYYSISSPSQANFEVDYTFVDNYLIAAPDVATISRAIQSREAGYTLTHSSTFQALLPSDGYTNFSAIFYHNTGPVIGPLVEQLKASGVLTPQQRQSADALTANSAPGLIYAYGESDRIVVASNTGFMGFDLGTLLTMGDNGPFLPQMLFSRSLTHSASQTQ